MSETEQRPRFFVYDIEGAGEEWIAAENRQQAAEFANSKLDYRITPKDCHSMTKDKMLQLEYWDVSPDRKTVVKRSFFRQWMLMLESDAVAPFVFATRDFDGPLALEDAANE